MIKVKGKQAIFTGKEAIQLKKLAKLYNLSIKDCFTGMMWEFVMRKAREGLFREKT
jgi:hypothetical protein